ncbi:MAG TPA: PEGA domain-containing protein [Caldisericia bacterium]|nr:PEGA domain-containing protein [Caldisericia bacterium]HPF49508.1 PEGA domain-containing protein [Caldisericia bacterium]HPI84198.1 PEGA domain-containing protein [Caldisericia bacterium]HPQ93507.1 PEGA domain-containing protein [Caldisericia bacterium]HRV75487.1 PEGA domain-containing protein [Caldisericia bacterium]
MRTKDFLLIVVEAVLILAFFAFFGPLGYLEIQVEPPGSTLFLDGEYIGHSPVYLAFITPRNYHLEIGKVATENNPVTYKGLTSNIQVGRYTKTKTKFSLEPLYSYKITTDPEGALVSVDGKMQEGVTPLTVDGLTQGTHDFTFSVEGHPPIKKVISTDSSPANIQVNFLGNMELSIKTNIDGASVFIGGEFIGETPCIAFGVPDGEHEIEIKLDGYKDIKRIIDLDVTGTELVFTLEMR